MRKVQNTVRVHSVGIMGIWAFIKFSTRFTASGYIDCDFKPLPTLTSFLDATVPFRSETMIDPQSHAQLRKEVEMNKKIAEFMRRC